LFKFYAYFSEREIIVKDQMLLTLEDLKKDILIVFA
jgi:hypothetical protein